MADKHPYKVCYRYTSSLGHKKKLCGISFATNATSARRGFLRDARKYLSDVTVTKVTRAKE